MPTYNYHKGDMVRTNRHYKKITGLELTGTVKRTEYFGKYVVFRDSNGEEYKIKHVFIEIAN